MILRLCRTLSAVAAAALAATLLVPPSAAVAEDADPKLPWKRLVFFGGGMVFNFDSEIALDTSSGNLGTSINLEDVLGLEEDLVSYRIGADWRVRPRHRFDLQYYSIKRDGNRSATGGFDFGDIEVGLGAGLDSTLKLDTYKASYNYSFIQTPKWDVHAGLGLHAMDLSMRLTVSGAFSIKDPDGVIVEDGGAVTEEFSVLAPLPVVGFGGAYAITPRLFLRGKVDIFALEFDDYRGQLIDGIVGIDYDFTDNLGIGAAFNLVDIGVEANKDRFVGSLDYRYGGLMVYARLFM